MTGAAMLRLRATLAGAAALVGAAVFRLNLGSDPKPASWIPVLGPVAAAVLAHVPSLGAQLLARGLWWSNLVLGVILCALGSRRESAVGLSLVIGCGAALVIADRRALAAAAERAGFRPVAFAGTIQLMMVLALADAPTLLLFATLESDHPASRAAVALAATAAALLVGFIGLYRLALWGVLVNVGASLALGAALATRALSVERDLVTPLLALSALQVLVALPMLASIVTRRPLPAPSARTRGALATALVVALALASVAVSLSRSR